MVSVFAHLSWWAFTSRCLLRFMLIIVLAPFSLVCFYCCPPFLVGIHQQMFIKIYVCHCSCPFRCLVLIDAHLFGWAYTSRRSFTVFVILFCPFRLCLVFLSVYIITQKKLNSTHCHIEIVILTKMLESDKIYL